MEVGSFRKALAVLSAACFWAKDVPWAGTSVGGDDGLVDKFENLDCKLCDCEPCSTGFEFGDPLLPLLRPCPELGLAGSPPIPSPGTRIPAEPSLLRAPRFNKPPALFTSEGCLEYGGGASGKTSCDGGEVCRGGNRGGNGGLSFGDGLVEDMLAEPWASPYRTGGLGRFLVDKPVVSAR